MQISPDLVKWNIVREKATAGTLEDDLLEIDEGDDWADNQCSWANDSFMHYCHIGEAVDLLVPNLEGELRFACEKSLSWLFNETGDMPKELGDALDPEYFVASISPATIEQLIADFKKVDRSTLLNEYVRHIGKDLQDNIGEPKHNFIGYIEQWVNALGEARAKGMGLIVHVG